MKVFRVYNQNGISTSIRAAGVKVCDGDLYLFALKDKYNETIAIFASGSWKSVIEEVPEYA